MNKETGAVPKIRSESKCLICPKPAKFDCANCTKKFYCSKICHDLDDQCKSKVPTTQQFGCGFEPNYFYEKFFQKTGAIPKIRSENRCKICVKPAQFDCANCAKILYCSQICHDLDNRNQCELKVLATPPFGQFGDLAGPMPTSKPTQRPTNVLAIAKKPEFVVGDKRAMLPLQARTNNVLETPKPKHHATKVEEKPIQVQLQDVTEAIRKFQLPTKATFDKTKKPMLAKWKSHVSIPENNTPFEVFVTSVDQTKQCIWVVPMTVFKDLYGYLVAVTKIYHLESRKFKSLTKNDCKAGDLVVYRGDDDNYYRTEVLETGPQIKIRMIDFGYKIVLGDEFVAAPAMANEALKPAFAFKIIPNDPMILGKIKCGSQMVIKIISDDPKIAQIISID